MARSVDANIIAKQNSQIHSPKYVIRIKPSRASLDEEYVDITDIVESCSIDTNREGDPNTATLNVLSYEGEYDVVNVLSENHRLFKRGSMVEISAGFEDPDSITDTEIIFYGYVSEGYKQKYKVGSKEGITIKLIDRGFFLLEKVTTGLYQNMSIGSMLLDILETHAGFTSDEVDFEALQGLPLIREAQFVDETLWDIVCMCGETMLLSPYFAVIDDGTPEVLIFDSYPDTFLGEFVINHTMTGTGTSALQEHNLEHAWDDNDLSSEITVVGALKTEEFQERRHVIYVCPNWIELGLNSFGAGDIYRGTKDYFELMTGGDGNWMYDSLYWDPEASGNDRMYGVGYQGTLECYGGTDWTEGQWAASAGLIADADLWSLTCQGPFPYTQRAIQTFADIPFPNEPYQTVKTGIADDQGTTGYFPDYNDNGGTNISVDPETLSLSAGIYEFGELFAWGGVWKTAWESLVNGHAIWFSGMLPTKDTWDTTYKIFTDVDYPFETDHGPSSTEYYTFFLVKAPLQYNHSSHGGPYTQEWDGMVIPFGFGYSADLIVEEARFTGTATDSELFAEYGTTRYDEVENDLLFSDDACAELATSIVERRKLFYVQGRLIRELNLQIEPGDIVDYYNMRTGCTETFCITRIKYDFSYNPSKGFSMELFGGVLESNGTRIQVW